MQNDFLKRYENLKKINEGDKNVEIRRGLDFEKLIQDVFDCHKLLMRRSYYTKDNRSEQIDGVIEFSNNIALLETKWKESNIAASELYSFIGKIENKFVGTIGIFISKEKLSDNFINSLNKGRRQSVIILHNKDIEDILDPKFPLKQYLIEVRRSLSMDNVNYLPTKEFLSEYTKEVEGIIEPAEISRKCKKILKRILAKGKEDLDGILIDIEAECSREEKYFILNYLLDKVKTLDYRRVYFQILERNYRIVKVINKLLEYDGMVEQSWTTFFKCLKNNPENYIRESFLELYKEKIVSLIDQEQDEFCRLVVTLWNRFYGDWDKENALSIITDIVWDSLDGSKKCEMKKYFFDIVASDRKIKYPQKQLAMKIIKQSFDQDKGKLQEEVIKWIGLKINEEYEIRKKGETLHSIDIKENSDFFAKTYDEIREFVGIDRRFWEKTIFELYQSRYGSA